MQNGGLQRALIECALIAGPAGYATNQCEAGSRRPRKKFHFRTRGWRPAIELPDAVSGLRFQHIPSSPNKVERWIYFRRKDNFSFCYYCVCETERERERERVSVWFAMESSALGLKKSFRAT